MAGKPVEYSAMRSIHLAVCLSGAMMLLCCARVIASQQETAPPAIAEIAIPLENGRVQVRDLVRQVSEELGFQLPGKLNEVDWSIDVEGALGQAQLKAIERLANHAIDVEVGADRLTVRIDRAVVQQMLRDAERKATRWIGPDKQSNAEAARNDFGLMFLAHDNGPAPPERTVILVHGLDDPGMMWDDLIPQLKAAGFHVAVFRYPNDGPIAESADFLARVLEEQRRNGLRRVDVIAHSMGGLVVRDVLTRPAYYAGDGAGGGRFPSIDRFIMIGTPNHGALMAKFRFLSQAGEQVSRFIKGQGLAGNETGGGEAGVDLLPDSDFLRRLNARPLASHTRHTIIMSQWVTIESDRLTRFFEGALDALEATSDDPAWRSWLSRENMQAMAKRVENAGDALGDGCVSIESARLEGVEDFVLLQGNHVSVLWNGPLSDDLPPVVPVVLERLRTPMDE